MGDAEDLNKSDRRAGVIAAEDREEVWLRLDMQKMRSIKMHPLYFIQITRGFAFESKLYSPGFRRGDLYWAWDVFQGRVIPLMTVIRGFSTLGEAQDALQRLLQIDHDNVRRTICHAEPVVARHFPQAAGPETQNDAFLLMYATELPPRQHGLEFLAREHGEEPAWIAAVIKGVQEAIEYLTPLGLRPVLHMDSVFLRGGKADKPVVSQVIRMTPDYAGPDADVRALAAAMADATGLQMSYTDMFTGLDAAEGQATDGAGFFDDDLGTPLIFEQVGNCPIVLRETCRSCKHLVKSAGFHLRGADCTRPARHFVCARCVNQHVLYRMDQGDLDLELIPCSEPGCDGLLDFDDFGALLEPALLRDWNKRGRAAALAHAEEEVNNRIAELAKR